MSIDLVQAGFQPFIYHGQQIHAQNVGSSERPFLRSSYALWHLHDGGANIDNGAGPRRLPPDGVALTEPGATVEIGPGSHISLVVFDIIARRRRRLPGGRAWRVPLEQPQPRWREIFACEQPGVLSPDWQQRSAHLVDQLSRDYWIDTFHHSEANARLQLWLLSLARHCRDDSPQPNDSPRDPLASLADHYIRTHYTSAITVDDVARHLGVSRPHLVRKMSAHGCTPGRLLYDLRMLRARRLLEEGDLPIQIIPARVGYRSASSFAAAFKRSTGQTPRAYRRDHSP